MLTSSSISASEPSRKPYTVENASALTQQMQIYSREQISGRLDLQVASAKTPLWSLFFYQGRVIWGAGGTHPLRHWNRQLSKHCPHLAVDTQTTERPKVWDYSSLINQVNQGHIPSNTLTVIVVGNILELLFDVIQASQQLHPSTEIQLTYMRLPPELTTLPQISIPADQAWQQAQKTWRTWQKAGLTDFSPNLAPIIHNPEGLRQQTSLLAYHNLSKLANGHWTLRDLAIKLKQPLTPLTQSLIPYVHEGIMDLTPVNDIRFHANSNQGALIAYIEDSNFDSAMMKRLLAPAGYRLLSINDSMQALPILIEHKPDLIFLGLLTPGANGYEICAQIRRIAAFKDTPVIILTSNNGIVDRVRAKLVGATGFLAKPLAAEQVLSTLQQYLSVSSPSA
jgi:two-component system, chemotaxis family, response regulator PixG